MNGGPVEDYLARLRAGLRTPPARTAEIVAEAEDHLRESAAARQTAGLDEEAAQRAAVAAFGPVKQVIRAHRPTLSAYAATAGMRAWPLFGCYLLLSALLGGVWVWREHGLVVTRVTWHGNNFLLRGKPEPVQFAAILGGCAAAGLVVVAGFLVVRRGLAAEPLRAGGRCSRLCHQHTDGQHRRYQRTGQPDKPVGYHASPRKLGELPKPAAGRRGPASCAATPLAISESNTVDTRSCNNVMISRPRASEYDRIRHG